MRKLVVLIALVVASPALGVTRFACSPMFLANPQGRPLANAAVSITNLDGSEIASGVKTTASATAPDFGGTMPSNQILQVYIEAGVYSVSVTGEGLSKQFKITCGDEARAGATIMEAYWTADSLLPSDVAPPLQCELHKPCRLIFSEDAEETVQLDFLLPSYDVSFRSLTLSWFPAISTGLARWKVDWCSYAVGEVPCAPDGTNATTFSSSGTNGKRVDLVLTAALMPVPWASDDHVVVLITRAMSGNVLVGAAMLEGARLEFNKL